MGYGSQALALKYLGVPFEHWKICEWAVKSIQAYKDIHFPEDTKDYSKGIEIGQIKEFLFNKGISSNYNESMSKEQINRLNEDNARTIYNNIKATNNLVNIQQVKGKDLDIKDTDKYTYILTYSFPCQDLSLAGVRKGMSDTSTRSGMLWEVERILQECKDLGTFPECLIMENVPQVHGEGNVEDFNKWQLKLEELGYKNYWQDLIATDYGIPQTRNRTFMVSVLGDYNYTFPKPIPLKLKLKDMLEDNVDEKYFLSDKQINDIQSWNAYEKPLENMEKTDKQNISPTLTTRSGAYAAGMILIKNANKKGYLEAKAGDGVDISSRMEYHRGTVQKGKTQTLSTMGGENNGVVVEDTLKKDLCNKLIQDGLVEEGDVVKHSYTQQILDGNKKCVEKNDGNMITLTTRGDCVGVCVGTYQYAKSDKFMQGKDRLQLGKETFDTLQTSPKEGVVINPLKGVSGKSWQFEQQVYDENGCARTLKASEGSGNIPKVMTIGNYSPSKHNASRIVDKDYSAPTVMENHGTITAIVDDKESVYSASERALFTEDGNIRRYMNSDIIDQFEEGQMATTTYPNGYGHGPRTHNESVSLNTIDKPSVKHNLRIRKLTPNECFRLMGVKDEDFKRCAKNQSDASLYHLAGDSIVVDVIKSIFKEMIE